MTEKKKPRLPSTQQDPLPLSSSAPLPPPDFFDLLSHPVVSLPLPRDFHPAVEADHLRQLWDKSSELRTYHFEAFIHAGGSGMVFKVLYQNESAPLALKIAREKLYSGKVTNPNAARSLSPVAPQELRALKRLSHANIVHLHDALSDSKGVFAIATSFVENPKPIDQFLQDTLGQHPDLRKRKGIHSFSPERLDRACAFLVARFNEIVDALCHMHEQRLFHCDLKPANILIDSGHHAILTDLGACVHPDDADPKGYLRIQFTWTYAHPRLTDLVSDPHGISGGGLKASAQVRVAEGLERFDLFALGRTIQETLAYLLGEFGERCYAAYNFRFLHLIAALLLDGRNATLNEKIRRQDGRRFIKDAALDYPVDLFAKKKLTTAKLVSERLHRFSRSYWPYEHLPELDPWQPDVINTGIDSVVPFPERVAKVFRHPAVRRLRSELQLGWVRELYPGATHTRWSHSLGVFAAASEYYAALLADPEVPAARILLDPADIEHGLVAAMLHDIGQTAFGHDCEAAIPHLYDHERLMVRILDDQNWGKPTLRTVIEQHWPRVDLKRVLAILQCKQGETKTTAAPPLFDPVDGIARDILNGPIDADKLDYLVRDSASCRVPYGLGIDRQRFLRALTMDAKDVSGQPRLALAYRAKGAAAIESLLLARYQMYGAVYWHHTFRCIQAMFSYAIAATFGALDKEKISFRKHQVARKTLQDLFYFRVVCGHPITRCEELIKVQSLPVSFFEDLPLDLIGERALEFVWRFADDRVRDEVLSIGVQKEVRRQPPRLAP